MAEKERNPKAATPATPAKKREGLVQSLGKQEDYGPNVDVAPQVWGEAAKKAEAEAKKAQDESNKVEASAQEKAGKINAKLASKGDGRRVIGSARGGKERFHWGNFVPTQELTEEDAKAAEAM